LILKESNEKKYLNGHKTNLLFQAWYATRHPLTHLYIVSK
jgi:hypothetical protein